MASFRLAAGCLVKGRWKAFEHCVFVNIIEDFKQHQDQQRAALGNHRSAPPGGRRVSRDPPGGLPRELEANLDSHQSSDRPQSGGRLVRLPVVDDVVDAVREHVSPDTTHALHPSFQFITMPHRFKLNHLGPMRRIFSAVLRSRGHGDGGDSHKHAPMRLVSKKAPLE